MITGFRARALRNLLPPPSLIPAAFVMVLLALAGCADSTKPQVASITFATDSSGTELVCTTAIASDTPSHTPVCSPGLLPSLAAGGPGAYIFANVTNDNQNLGVSWTVTCGSATPLNSGALDTSCGTFQPPQTLSGPVPPYTTTGIVTTYNAPPTVPKGGTVTIVAHATSLPSVTSAVTLTITAAKSGVELPASKNNAFQTQAARPVESSSTSGVTRWTQRPGV